MPRSKILKGRMLGIATTIGDHFTYVVLPLNKDGSCSTPVCCSVVRRRSPRKDDVYIQTVAHDPSQHYFMTADGRRLEGETDLTPVAKEVDDQHGDQSGKSIGSSDVEYDMLGQDDRELTTPVPEAIVITQSPSVKETGSPLMQITQQKLKMTMR